MLDRRLQRIADGLEILARRDTRFSVFGSEKHRHRLDATLADSEAEAFEREERVSLPAEYRAFPEDGNPYDGCVELADVGCGYFHLLVVAGPRAGEVWSDTTAIRETGSLQPTVLEREKAEALRADP